MWLNNNLALNTEYLVHLKERRISTFSRCDVVPTPYVAGRSRPRLEIAQQATPA